MDPNVYMQFTQGRMSDKNAATDAGFRIFESPSAKKSIDLFTVPSLPPGFFDDGVWEEASTTMQRGEDRFGQFLRRGIKPGRVILEWPLQPYAVPRLKFCSSGKLDDICDSPASSQSNIPDGRIQRWIRFLK